MSKIRRGLAASEVEKLRAADRQWYEKNAVAMRARHKAYYERQRAAVLAQKKARRDGPDGPAIREMNRVYQGKRYASLPWVAAATRANATAWRRANPIKRREYDMRRNAIKRAASAEPVDYEAIWSESGGICGVCKGHVMVYDQIHFDHIVPLSRGGTHTTSNIQVAHAVCNMKKHDKLPSEVNHAAA